MTVLLLFWCCGGCCWGTYYCLVQSTIALFEASKCGPQHRFSCSKCKCKPRPWQKCAHEMKRRRRLAYHLMLRCHHRSGLRTFDGLKIFISAWRKHKRWKESIARSRLKYRKWNRHFIQPASKISNTVLQN